MPLPLAQYLQLTYYNDEDDNEQDESNNFIQIHLPKRIIKSVSASGQHIDSIGDITADLAEKFRQIIILDLSNTQINDSSLLVQILCLFPNLKELIISNNPQLKFNYDESNTISTSSSFGSDILLTNEKNNLPHVTTVISSNCSYNWSDVISFARNMWPSSINSLTLHANKISNIFIPHGTCFLQQLTHLDLSCNPLNEWNEVCNLTQLPRYVCYSIVIFF